MHRVRLWWSTSITLILLLSPASACAATVPGYTRELPPESSAARKFRHERVVERRAGTILLAHRGACTLASENTLEAYAAAMDYGADGCEVDVRRTADGVFVLFHDDMLDHLTDGFGEVEELSYTDLLALRPQFVHGAATRRTRPPTFAALLVLARQRAMLLHLDVKRPGLDEDIARILDEADLWDHVHSSLHADWRFNGLDGHTAARALGRLSAVDAAPVLIETFRRVDPELIRVRNPQWTNNPLSWVDWRKMSFVPALGELRCDASRKFLLEYVALNESEAGAISIPQFEEATKSLLRQKLTQSEILGLLKSSNSAVRGTAILECLDQPTPDRTAALRQAAPWALELPRARR